MIRLNHILIAICVFLSTASFAASDNVIEKQLQEIGTIQNEEVMVVQRKYTRKEWRHELNPVTFGGMPFGTVRRTLVGGASYTLHLSDWAAWEGLTFLYTKTFFSSFTDDINANRSGGTEIKPDYQKLLYFLTTGIQITPFYGKITSFSRWIAYIEPYFSLGAGIAKTETNSYFTFYPGIGIRAFFREWFSMRVELRDYIYSEKYIDRNTSGNITASSLRNNYAVMVGFSFWLPKMPR